MILAGHVPGLDDPPRTVGVDDERVERAHALLEPRRERVPLGRGQDARDRIDDERVVVAGREPHPGAVDAAR